MKSTFNTLCPSYCSLEVNCNAFRVKMDFLSHATVTCGLYYLLV